MIVFVVRDRPESGHEHEHEQSHEHVMRLAYGDIIGGISGDMFVAALLDLGLSLSLLKAELKKIPTLRFELKSNKKPVHSIRATQFHVICDKNDRPRSWQQIRQLIERGKVTPAVKETGLNIFTRLAQAEAKVHGVAVDKVHFHEVGATDSIVDIMAAAIGVQELGIEGFYFSTIPLGRGITRAQHGPLPVPGPATLELLKGLPVVGVDIESETVTPTGAAIVRSLGKNFGPQPAMVIEKIGYGTGQKEFVNRPNLVSLGARLGQSLSRRRRNGGNRNQHRRHEPAVLRSCDGSALRRRRAGCLLGADSDEKEPSGDAAECDLRDRDTRDQLAALIMQETTTIGIRYYAVHRAILKRETKKVKTRYGDVRLKIVEQPDGTKRATPEYDDLKRIAAAKNISLKTLYDAVLRNFK